MMANFTWSSNLPQTSPFPQLRDFGSITTTKERIFLIKGQFVTYHRKIK